MKLPTPQKAKSGMYYVRLRMNGKSKYIYGLTAKECKDKASLYKSQCLNGIVSRGVSETVTLRQACERYIAKKETAGKSPETIRGYDIILRNRFQSVMDKPVADIKDWQTVYDSEAEKYSPKTMKNTWSFLCSAVKSECGADLPTVETVALKRVEHNFLSPEEITRFVSAAKDDKYRIGLYLALCSCRASELLALEWQDVDLDNNRVFIHRARVRDKNNKLLDKNENKTASSSRYVPLFIPELVSALKQSQQKTGKVVPANENTLLEHSNAVCDKAGLPRVGVHGLRHSFASLAYSLNVPVKITMQIGGWSDLGTVMKIYTHLSQKDVGKHAEEISKFYSAKK